MAGSNVFRWYRSGWGRYTQADPIGFAGGLNLYGYVYGNPLNTYDALGLGGTKYPRKMPRPRTKNRPCNPEEREKCEEKCRGLGGILRCEVSQTLQNTRFLPDQDKALWDWVDGPYTCACRRDPDQNEQPCRAENRDPSWKNDTSERSPVPLIPFLPTRVPPKVPSMPSIPGLPPFFLHPCKFLPTLPGCSDPSGAI